MAASNRPVAVAGYWLRPLEMPRRGSDVCILLTVSRRGEAPYLSIEKATQIWLMCLREDISLRMRREDGLSSPLPSSSALFVSSYIPSFSGIDPPSFPFCTFYIVYSALLLIVCLDNLSPITYL